MIERRLIKDLARRLVFQQIKNEQYSINEIYKRLYYLLRVLIEGPKRPHISSYRPLMDEVPIDLEVDYIVTTDYEEAVHNVKDILLVPIYGYMQSGHRLGRGGGFYDKLIADTRPITIGIGTDAREVMFVPEEHDRKLNFIITESRVIVGKI